MYGLPTPVDSVRQLENIVRLADCYCACPALSRYLYTALWISPCLKSEISFNAKKFEIESNESGKNYKSTFSLLIIAYKLRHPVLFREMLVWVVSLWCGHVERTWTEILRKEHPLLLNAIMLAHYRVLRKQSVVQLSITGYRTDTSCDFCGYDDKACANWPSELSSELLSPTELAFYFRELVHQLRNANLEDPTIIEQLQTVLHSNLVITSGNPVAGASPHAYQFLCAEISDEELPWDRTQLDW